MGKKSSKLQGHRALIQHPEDGLVKGMARLKASNLFTSSTWVLHPHLHPHVTPPPLLQEPFFFSRRGVSLFVLIFFINPVFRYSLDISYLCSLCNRDAVPPWYYPLHRCTRDLRFEKKTKTKTEAKFEVQGEMRRVCWVWENLMLSVDAMYVTQP